MRPAIRFLLLPLLALALAGAARALTAAGEAPGCAAVDAGPERCEAGVPQGLLAAMEQRQLASNWCWAAAASMVLSRYGVAARQDDIVRGWFGAAVNLGAGVDALEATLNRRWNDSAGQAVRPMLVALAAELRRLAPDLLDDLRQGRPLLLGVNGHAMLLVKVVYEQDGAGGAPRLLQATVLDPAAQAGLRSLRSDELQPRFLARVVVGAAPLPP